MRSAPQRWLAILLLLAPLTGGAQERFFERGAEGYWWYQDPPPKEEREQPEPPPPPSPPPVAKSPAEPAPAGPPTFSVAWLEAKLPELRRAAIDDPTPQNLSAYLYAQRVMMDKADNFTRQWQRVVASDPLLDENNRFPIATAFRSVAMRAETEGREQALRYVGENAGLFYFFDASCSYCSMQWSVLERLSQRHAIPLRLVSMDGRPLPHVDAQVLTNQGQAQRMGIERVPAIVLAHPPATFSVLSQGFLPIDTLETRILLAAEHIGMLPEEILRLADPSRRGILTPPQARVAEPVPELGEHATP